jgi:DNA-binding response OmpR family regulator/DNA-binding CsgD family transcriptional regulator
MMALDSEDVVLVVDDSADALSLVNDTLEQAGISVLVALEGKQALTIARRMKPDMILLDAIMPKMDGFETCRQLKEIAELAAIPVIFMTGLTDSDSVVKALEAGGVDYITKPIRPDELLARMKVHLNNARLAQSTKQALDSTGQFLMTVNQQGELQWATPQAYSVFEQSDVTSAQFQQCVGGQLAMWLQHRPQPQQTLMLEGLSKPIEVVFIEAREGNQSLLKLVDGNKLSDEEILIGQLGVTIREADVLIWIARGKTNREIGQILGISPRTVNKHLEQVFSKLEVDNRTAAATAAITLLNK